MGHIVKTEVYIFLIPCFHFGPDNFVVSGQLRLSISYETFFNSHKDTTTWFSISVIPMRCKAMRKYFARFYCVLLWVSARFDSS